MPSRRTSYSRSRSRSPRRHRASRAVADVSHNRRRESRYRGESRREPERPRRPREDRHRDEPSPRRERRLYSRSPKRQRLQAQDSNQPPAAGTIHRGKVHTIKPFGVFVILEGYQRHGLVHHSQISEDVALSRDDDDADKVAALEYFCSPGSEVWVKVTEVQDDGRGGARVNCSMRSVDQENGTDLDPQNSLAGRQRGGPVSEEPPELGSIHRATVASIRPFGAFVRLEGYRSNGLVHVSQVSDHMETDKEDSDEAKTAALGQVLSIGEMVWVKVVDIKDAEPGSDRGPKIGCSIKLVSQKDGADLDPHGLKYRPRQVDGNFGSKRPVGADVGQVQEGTIDWGYLNADKVNMDPKYAAYDLVGAEVESLVPPENHGNAPAELKLPGPPPFGRGRDMIKPAWMTDQQQAKQGVNSIEEALAILRKHDKKFKKSKTKKKHKEDKKAKKSKKSKKKHSKQSSPSSTPESD